MGRSYEIVPIGEAHTDAVETVLKDAVGGDHDMRRARTSALARQPGGLALLLDGQVIAAVAGHPADATWIIDAIGTARSHRGCGGGRSMIEMLRVLHPARTLVAETDDDSVGFYRELGFLIDLLPPRWPGVNRYRCSRHPAL